MNYKIDISGDWISEEGYKDAYKRICRLIASMPPKLHINKLDYNIPLFDPVSKTVVDILLKVRDEIELEIIITILDNYCDLCFIPRDTDPTIINVA